MTADLVAFLHARLAEDEDIAQAATPSPWRIDPQQPNIILEPTPIDWVGIAGESQRNLFTGQLSSRFGQAKLDAAHIARHDPARVLADVQAKRRVIEMYRVHDTLSDQTGDHSFEHGMAAGFEDALTLLACAYADHPDFDPEWQD